MWLQASRSVQTWISSATNSSVAPAHHAPKNTASDGFNWGYGGSGPAQLALALLLEAGIDEARAVQLHQAFKWAIVAALAPRRIYNRPRRPRLGALATPLKGFSE
jgi:hypothetical protein